jgi:DNA gyrase subunit B
MKRLVLTGAAWDASPVDETGTPRRNTTHDWTSGVDVGHIEHIRQNPALFASGGVGHLVLEIVAYAGEEAEANNGGRCSITLHSDGSISVSDNGRGTDTRVDLDGRTVKKPVMVSRDLRFFDAPDAPRLPDGHPRRGISVVAALSEWLVHTNRRRNGAWTQRYEQAVPVTDLVPVTADGTTGTTVHFRPAGIVRMMGGVKVGELSRWTASSTHLSIAVNDMR